MSILHYPGDIELDPTQTLGPDMFGGFWAMKSAEFDGARTTATLRPLPPSELPDRARERLINMSKIEDVRALFGL